MKKLFGLIAVISFSICLTSCDKSDDEFFTKQSRIEVTQQSQSPVAINKDEVEVPDIP